MMTGTSLTSGANDQATIRITKDQSLTEEEYKLAIGEKDITLTCASSQGMLWAVQTLRQIILQGKADDRGLTLPQITIADKPKTAWRGFHIEDRKSTRLNSSHANISYAVFCLKKKKKTTK